MTQHIRAACDRVGPHAPHEWKGSPLVDSAPYHCPGRTTIREEAEQRAKRGAVINVETPKGSDLEYIITTLLPEISKKMEADGHDYGHTNHRYLGNKGQFSDIWRKVSKLKRSMWDGIPLHRESEREIMLDLIGHCLLGITMIDKGVDGADADRR